MLWHTPAIHHVLRKLQWDDQEFEASLSYMRPYFKKYEGWRDGSVGKDGLATKPDPHMEEGDNQLFFFFFNM